jgi:acyl carrier protein
LDGAIRTSAAREDHVMTVESSQAGPADQQLFAEIAGILLEVTGEGAEWAAGITPNARVQADLGMESVELVALGELLRRRYGPGVELSAFVAELDIDQIIALSVGDLAAYVAARRARASAPASGPGAASGPAAAPAAVAARPPVMPDRTPAMPGQATGGGA